MSRRLSIPDRVYRPSTKELVSRKSQVFQTCTGPTPCVVTNCPFAAHSHSIRRTACSISCMIESTKKARSWPIGATKTYKTPTVFVGRKELSLVVDTTHGDHEVKCSVFDGVALNGLKTKLVTRGMVFQIREYLLLVLGVWRSQLTFGHFDVFGIEMDSRTGRACFPFKYIRARMAALPKQFYGICTPQKLKLVPNIMLEVFWRQWLTVKDYATAETLDCNAHLQIGMLGSREGRGKRNSSSGGSDDENGSGSETGDTEDDLTNLSCKLLRQRCRAQELSDRGRKADLIARLREYQSQSSNAASQGTEFNFSASFEEVRDQLGDLSAKVTRGFNQPPPMSKSDFKSTLATEFKKANLEAEAKRTAIGKSIVHDVNAAVGEATRDMKKTMNDQLKSMGNRQMSDGSSTLLDKALTMLVQAHDKADRASERKDRLTMHAMNQATYERLETLHLMTSSRSGQRASKRPRDAEVNRNESSPTTTKLNAALSVWQYKCKRTPPTSFEEAAENVGAEIKLKLGEANDPPLLQGLIESSLADEFLRVDETIEYKTCAEDLRNGIEEACATRSLTFTMP